MAKPRKKASPPEPPRPRVPVIGERIRRPGSDTEFEITFVSVDYRRVHIGIPRTNFEYRNVEASTLTYLEQRETPPTKPYVDVDLVMEQVASVQRTALRNLASELATLKKFLKSKRAPAEPSRNSIRSASNKKKPRTAPSRRSGTCSIDVIPQALWILGISCCD